MVQNNLAYLAGIVDGEGYFFLEQARKNYRIPVLGVEMAEKTLLRLFLIILSVVISLCEPLNNPIIKFYIVGVSEGVRLSLY